MAKFEIEIPDGVVPDGYVQVAYRIPNEGEHFLANGDLEVCGVHRYYLGPRLILEKVWAPPAGAAKGLTFYPNCNSWFLAEDVRQIERERDETWCLKGCNKDAIFADKVFADFVPPPQRRPYTV